MIAKILWPTMLIALALVTGLLQLDRQADLSPALAPLVPQSLRNYAQPRIAALAAEGGDGALALTEAKRLVLRRPVPAEHLTLLAIAQTKAGERERAGLTIQIAGQRGWRDPVAQEAVLRLALAANDLPEAARRYGALFLRRATPDTLLSDLAPAVLAETDGPGQRALVDIISGTDRWNSIFLRRGVKVMPPATFADIAVASIKRGTRFDCALLLQTIRGMGQKDPAAAARVAAAARRDCPEIGP